MYRNIQEYLEIWETLPLLSCHQAGERSYATAISTFLESLL